MNEDIDESVVIRSVFPGEPSRVGKHSIRCRIGIDVRLYPDALEAFCFKTIDVRDEELVFLAGVIAFADRSVRRRAGDGWRRKIHVVVPVEDPRAWSQSEIVDSLIDALQYLTGDQWSFSFLKRVGRMPKVAQGELDLGQGEFVVMPFSNGLDSFAQSRLSRAEFPQYSPIRVTAWNRGLSGGRDWVVEADGSRWRRVAVPIRVAINGAADQTYRTRSFLFSVLAGLASHMSGAESIIVPEAGQGSLGPSLLPLGAESPHRGSHPGFSRRMMKFFEAFWSAPMKIEHPQLWRTKGEVLSLLKKKDLHAGWDKTRSCSRDQRHVHTKRHTLLHCGICSGCILRRLAVFSAELTEPASNYVWSDLSAESLEKSLCSDASRPTTRNDRDIAVHAIMAMEDLARQADLDVNHVRFQTTLFDPTMFASSCCVGRRRKSKPPC